MKTVISILEDVKDILQSKTTTEATRITGEIRLLTRRLGSNLEDIILSTVYADAEQVQEAMININIHVPNLKNMPSNTPNALDNTQPSIQRLFEIARVLSTIIDDYRGNDFFITVNSDPEYINFEAESFVNFQVIYTHFRDTNAKEMLRL